MGMVYAWKPGSRVPVKADIAAAEIERLRRKTGYIAPADVLDASRPPQAPLHKAFEWDDSVAAEHYRLNQASHIIRSVVMIRNDEPPSEAVRAFVSATEYDSDKATYTSTERALSTPGLREQVLASAFADMEAFERKHAALIELSEVIGVMRRTKHKLRKGPIEARTVA